MLTYIKMLKMFFCLYSEFHGLLRSSGDIVFKYRLFFVV